MGDRKKIEAENGELLELEEIISVAIGDFSTKVIEFANKNYDKKSAEIVEKCVNAALEFKETL